MLILVHGRGGSAADMLGLASQIAGPKLCFMAPEAAGNSWYPYRFIEPTSRNQPHLDLALSVLGDLVDRLVDNGVDAGRIALLGFSQGACLVLQSAFITRRKLGAVIGLSGGLIGDVVDLPAAAPEVFGGMPLLLGCSDHDAHIPIGRVLETETVFRSLGAEVTTRIYPGSQHGINADEVTIARDMLARLAMSGA